MCKNFIILTIILFILMSCETQNAVNHKQEVSSVLDLLIEADRNSDLNMAIQQYREDAILMPPNGMPIIGKNKIKKHYTKLFANIAFVELNITNEETLVSKDWAVISGKTSASIKEKDSIYPVTKVGKFVMVFKKDSLKSWKIHRLIWNDTPDKP